VEDWSNISQQELTNLLSAVLEDEMVCSGTHYSISVRQMSVKFVQFMSFIAKICQQITGRQELTSYSSIYLFFSQKKFKGQVKIKFAFETGKSV